MKENPTTKTTSVDFYAYTVQERDGQKSVWDRIGVAFTHRDGNGINVILRAVPVDGRLTLRVPSEPKEPTAGE